MARLLERLGGGVQWVGSLAVAFWACETANIVTAFSHLEVGPLATASVLLFGLLIAASIPLGLLMGLVHHFAGTGEIAPWYRRLGHWLTSGVADTQHRRGAGVLAMSVLVTAVNGVGYWSTRMILREVVREKYQAYLIMIVVGALILTAIWLFPVVRGLFYRVVRRASTVPGLGPAVRKSRNIVVLLLLIGAAVLIWVIRSQWGPLFSHVRWAPIVVVSMAALLSIVLWEVWRAVRRHRFASKLLAGLLYLLAAASLVHGVQISPYEWTARRLAFHTARSGRVLDVVLDAYLDFDDDGYLSVFGGGDCAPHDPDVHPGAIDQPSNEIDEDCSGEDLTPDAFLAGGAYDYPVRERVPSRPNVVLITVDALAARHMALLGYDRETTPNIDAFAERSAFFESCFAQGPSTRLSFPSIFTSRWDSQLERVTGPRMPRSLSSEQHQIQDLFKEAGYVTAAVVSEGYFTRQRWASMVRDFDELDESPATAGTHTAPQVTEAALRILNAEREEPLFLWVHYYDAHSPYQAIDDFEGYGSSQRDLYDTELRYLDQEIAPLLEALEGRGDTLSVLTSDHGTVFHPQPRTRRSRYGFDLYTATLHVPLIMHAGFINPGRFTHIVSTMDIVPTLANVLRAEEGAEYEGFSLVPEIFEGRPNRPDRVFAQFFLPERAMRGQEPLQKVALRTERFNLIFSREGGSYELYDWREDYYEMEDLAEEGNRDLALLRSVLSAYVLAMTEQDEEEAEEEAEEELDAGADEAPADVAPSPAGRPSGAADAGRRAAMTRAHRPQEISPLPNRLAAPVAGPDFNVPTPMGESAILMSP